MTMGASEMSMSASVAADTGAIMAQAIVKDSRAGIVFFMIIFLSMLLDAALPPLCPVYR